MAAVVACAACRADATVAVDVARNGSGAVRVTVVLDRAAAAELGDPAAVPLDDLRARGWEVAPVAADPSTGAVTFRALHRFRSPGEVPGLLEQVGGRNGVFRSTSLEVDAGPLGTDYRFATRVVLSGEPAQFSDPALTEVLGGLALGRTPEELAALAMPPGSGVGLRLEVRLPPGRSGSWEFPVTGGTLTDERVGLSSSVPNTATRQQLLGAGGLLLLALLALTVGLVRRRRGRRRAAAEIAAEAVAGPTVAPTPDPTAAGSGDGIGSGVTPGP